MKTQRIGVSIMSNKQTGIPLCLLLVACELAEAVEADREGRRADRKTYNFLLQEYGEELEKHLFEMHIKDTL